MTDDGETLLLMSAVRCDDFENCSWMPSPHPVTK